MIFFSTFFVRFGHTSRNLVFAQIFVFGVLFMVLINFRTKLELYIDAWQNVVCIFECSVVSSNYKYDTYSFKRGKKKRIVKE